MPTLDNIVKEKLERLNSVPDGMVSEAQSAQKRLLSEVERILSSMDIQGGNFVFNEANILKLEQVNNLLSQAIFNSSYQKELTNFAKEFNIQAELTDEYYKIVVDEFKPAPLYDATILNNQRNAINLLTGDSVSNTVAPQIAQTIQSAITNGQSFSEVMTTIRNFVTPEGADGILEKYVKQVAFDSFAVGDRSYTDAIAQDLGLEFGIYQGGEIATTRCFCDERNGKYYHRKEVEEWGNRKNIGACAITMGDGSRGWAGMNKNTNKATIFSLLGGYNCGHNYLPVSIKSVPKSVIDRARQRGFVK